MHLLSGSLGAVRGVRAYEALGLPESLPEATMAGVNKNPFLFFSAGSGGPSTRKKTQTFRKSAMIYRG